MVLRFEDWSGTQVWSFDWYLGFGACSGTQVLEPGVVLRIWSLEWYAGLELEAVIRFGALSGAHILSLEWYSGLELGVVLRFGAWSGTHI